MFYTYLISSVSNNWVYAGITEDIETRVKRHNSKQVRSTKSFAPFNLIFVQISDTRKTAREYEKFLKVRWNKESLLEIIN